MARAGEAYVVRDDGAQTQQGNVDKLFPYTLRGLTGAAALFPAGSGRCTMPSC